MKSGELFAGVGGLGMAVDEVFGSTPGWFCEFDADPSKVLAHRYPDVPNFGDVRTVTDPPKVDILAGGFPCQDVSLAGRRRGMKEGTRSGLWSEFARIIDTVRPSWVVIENVRGLLSADAAGDVESCPWCLADDGEQHALRALGAVLGDLADLGFDAEWTGLRAADVGAPHGRFRVFILAWPRERTVADDNGAGFGGVGRTPGIVERDAHRRARGGQTPGSLRLLSTPDTVPEAPNTGSNSHKAGNIVGLGNQVLSLLPTPVAQPSGNTPEEHLRKKPGREVVTDLAIIAENGLIETGGRILPTPTASLGDHRRDYGQPPEARMAGGHSVSTADAARAIADAGTGWGPYEAAIRRWEAVTGRPAPAPVRFDGKGGKPRLNPELTEWMMGWPKGWVTDPEISPRLAPTPEPFVNKKVSGLSRAEQLKACGNGVVTLQAVAALRELLSRPGVPSIRQAVAA